MNSTKPSPGSSASSGGIGGLGEAHEALVGERLEQVLLGREVAVDRADAHPGVARDLVDLRVEPLLGEQLARGHEHLGAVAPGVGALCAGGAHSGA